MIADNERIGKFEIDTEYIENSDKRERLYKLFSYMIVLRAESLLYRNAIEYVAISPLFEARPLGEVTPEYTIIFDQGRIHAIKGAREKPARLMTLNPASED